MDAFWTLWWVWLSAALALAILETLIPGFIFLGFAVAAALIGVALALLPWTPGLPLLLAIFAVLSLIAWLAMRRVFRASNDQTRVIHEDINK